MSTHIYSKEELIHTVRPLLKKYCAERAVLFGSYAREEATAWSLICTIIFEVLPEFYGAANEILKQIQ